MADADVQPEPAVEQPVDEEPEVNEEEAEEAEEAQDGAATGKAPVKMGYAEFPTAKSAKDFFRHLLSSWPSNTDCNEYEHRALLDLLKHHPDFERKLGVGVRAFQVRPWGDSPPPPPGPGKRKGKEPEESGSKAFYVVHKDGSAEDFSYIKCLAAVFPSIHPRTNFDNKKPRTDGGGGRGRGGRGGSSPPSRGRGRGRGGRGRGRR